MYIFLVNLICFGLVPARHGLALKRLANLSLGIILHWQT